MYVDSHIHLSRKAYDGSIPCVTHDEIQSFLNRDLLIEKMKEEIEFVIEPAVELETNYQLLDLANRYPDFVYPVIGVHPTRSFQTKWKDRKVLDELSLKENVVAIGELGLDYHYKRKDQHRLKQMMWFIYQLHLAHKRNLPLVLHIRDAYKDAYKILKMNKDKLHGGVCHCFTEGVDVAKKYTEEFGFYLGIGGSLLQKNAEELIEAVKETPLEYIILETDGPFVKPPKPEAYSKKQWQKARNTSLIISDIAKKVADIKGIPVEEVEHVTTENAKKLFSINQ